MPATNSAGMSPARNRSEGSTPELPLTLME